MLTIIEYIVLVRVKELFALFAHIHQDQKSEDVSSGKDGNLNEHISFSQFPSSPHHQVKIGVCVYGRADPAVVIAEFLERHL